MKHAAWVLALIALLVVVDLGGRAWRRRTLAEWSRIPSVHHATGRGTNEPKDPAAREFWQYGRERGTADGSSVGIDSYHGVSSMPSHVLGDLPDRVGAPRGTPLGEALTYLALEGGGLRDTPEIRKIRARRGPMAQAYRLYRRLRNAPSQQQRAYAAALDGGYSRGFSLEKPKFERKMAAARQERQDRLRRHRRLTTPLLTRTPDADLEEAVMDYAINKIGNDWGHDYQRVIGLPRPIQIVFAMRRMKNEIDGDGLEHLVDEPDSWQYADLALEGYRMVGSKQRAAVMQRAIAAMNKEKTRQSESETGSGVLSALDRDFYALDRSEPLEPLVTRYIRQHLSQFVAD